MNQTGLRDTGVRLRAAWAGLGARERRLIGVAALVVALALLWLLALAPALSTLRSAPAQRQALQAETERMQMLWSEAEAVKALPRLGHDEARRALEAATRARLGRSGQLSITGDRAQLVLHDAPAQSLADWLVDARANARAAVLEGRLTRVDTAGADGPTRWRGTLSLGLPPP